MSSEFRYNHENATRRFGTAEQAYTVTRTAFQGLVTYLDLSGVFKDLDTKQCDIIIDAVTDVEGTLMAGAILQVIGVAPGPVLTRLKERAGAVVTESRDDEPGQAPAPAQGDEDELQA